jgi:hypothetical protein
MTPQIDVARFRLASERARLLVLETAMTGWQIETITRGVETDTRKIIELWAVWIGDKDRAREEARLVSGAEEANCLGAMSEAELLTVGLQSEGQIRRTKAVF